MSDPEISEACLFIYLHQARVLNLLSGLLSVCAPGQIEVHEVCEVTALIGRALSRRCTKSTRVNADSSRSHCLFTLKLDASNTRGQTRRGCLHVVDLAGSERLSKSGSAEDPALLKEAQVRS